MSKEEEKKYMSNTERKEGKSGTVPYGSVELVN
jgi:hypothetical protein